MTLGLEHTPDRRMKTALRTKWRAVEVEGSLQVRMSDQMKPFTSLSHPISRNEPYTSLMG